MKLYMILGRTDKKLLTEKEVQQLKSELQPKDWNFIPTVPPWEYTQWNSKGGRGNRIYPPGEQINIKVPRAIAHEVKKYAVWLASQQS